jgi:hypothetical protein
MAEDTKPVDKRDPKATAKGLIIREREPKPKPDKKP